MRLLLLGSLLFCFQLISAQGSKPLTESFESGDSEMLSQYFKASIDLNLPEKHGIFQKKQATLLLEEFFGNNPPRSFSVKHEGGSKQKSSFQIGKLSTEKGDFRTYLLYNLSDGVPQIIELRIEEE